MTSVLHLLGLLLLLCIASPAHAQLPAFPGRAPFAPGPPDPCSGIALPCAQLNDITLTSRLAGQASWPGAGYRWSGGGTLGITGSLLKTLELGLSVPLAYVQSDPGAWVAGPPEVRLRWRMGPRMGWPPFGGRWPEGEPFYKALPAAYDLAPARWTLSMGLTFRPLWAGLTGSGPPLCRGDQSGCLYETAMTAAWDLRLWRLLFTGQLGAHVLVGGGSAWSAGGRAALDVGGVASLFSEALLRQGLLAISDRQGLVLVGAQVLPFRGARVSAWWGRAFGGWAGGQLAGLALDIPIGIHGYGLRTLAKWLAAIDPFIGGDGWLYDDACRPLFRLGAAKGDQVWDETRKAWIPVGTHLWRRGDTLYFDPDAKRPYGPIKRTEGTPPLVTGVAELPWPDLRDQQALSPEGRAWLRRYARAPDPARRAQCEQLMADAAAELDRGARAPTLADACAEAKQNARTVEEISRGDVERGHNWGAQMGALLAQAAYCGTSTPAGGLLGVVGKGRAGAAPAGPRAGAAAPPGTPAGAGAAPPASPPQGARPAAASRPGAHVVETPGAWIPNKHGVAYPQVTDLKTGQPMAFPAGPLQVVPEAQRAPWTNMHRYRFIKEWHDRGYPEPPGGWGRYEVHHIQPRLYGGSNDFDNLTPLPKEVHNGIVSAWWTGYEP